MDSLQDLLARYEHGSEPDEISATKRYIMEQFNVDARVGIYNNLLVIIVPSASLANTLRLRIPTLQKIANTKRRIMLRIG